MPIQINQEQITVLNPASLDEVGRIDLSNKLDSKSSASAYIVLNLMHPKLLWLRPILD